MRGIINALLVISIILIYTQSCLAIECIECNTHMRKDCDDKFHITDETKKYIKDCGENVTMCRKIVQEVYIINDWHKMKGDWNTRIIRQCAPTTGKVDCIDRTGTKQIKVKYCHCTGNKCNGSSHIQAPVFILFASLLISMGLFVNKYL